MIYGDLSLLLSPDICPCIQMLAFLLLHNGVDIEVVANMWIGSLVAFLWIQNNCARHQNCGPKSMSNGSFCDALTLIIEFLLK